MIITRKTQVETDVFKLEDQIKVPLHGFGIFTATVHSVADGKALFIFDECVVKRNINETNTNEGGFRESDLYKWLDDTLFASFPVELKRRIVADEDLHFLTIPTYGQIFGHDDWYESSIEHDNDERLPLMSKTRYRIGECGGESCAYWLRNSLRASSTYFALCNSGGYSGCNGASAGHGVRPLFSILNQ